MIDWIVSRAFFQLWRRLDVIMVIPHAASERKPRAVSPLGPPHENV